MNNCDEAILFDKTCYIKVFLKSLNILIPQLFCQNIKNLNLEVITS